MNDYLRYLYAYDSSGNIIDIQSAQKGEKYFLDLDKRYEIIVRDGDVRIKHFSLKANYSGINESPAHYNAKMNIIKNGYFNYLDNIVYIKNCNPEVIINESQYRADIKGELLDGTECIIEIIVTSEIKEDKIEFLKNKNILTFELYYDKNGDQIIRESNYFGKRELENIKTEKREIQREINFIKETTGGGFSINKIY